MDDFYSHNCDNTIIYITECIPGPVDDSEEYDLLLNNYNSQLLACCDCDQACLKTSCECLQISRGDNYEKYTDNGKVNFRLNYKSDVVTAYPIIECNTNCSCLPDCGNRVVQNGPAEGLIVLPCANEKGLGLFTSQFIHKGTFICEYAGELLTKTQALARSKENESKGTMNYIFCLNEHTTGGIVQTFVDPSKFGNIGRYLNHSCDPNCKIIPVRIETVIPKLAIFACRDILPDEELTFNYGVSDNTESQSEDTATKRKQCLCKAENCKVYMPFDQF